MLYRNFNCRVVLEGHSAQWKDKAINYVPLIGLSAVILATPVLADSDKTSNIVDPISRVISDVKSKTSIKVEMNQESKLINVKTPNKHGISSIQHGLGDSISSLNTGNVNTDSNQSDGVHSEITNTKSKGKVIGIIKSGKITTNGKSSRGISAYQHGLGSAELNIEGGSIETTGEKSSGLLIKVFNDQSKEKSQVIFSNKKIDKTSETGNPDEFINTIKTQGDQSIGILISSLSQGEVNVIVEKGSIETNGAKSSGISVNIENKNSKADNKIEFKNSKLIASGDKSHGIEIKNYGHEKSIILVKNSHIKSGSGEASAIHIVSAGGSGSIDINGTSVIDGADSGSAIVLKKIDVSRHTSDTVFTITSTGTVDGDVMLGAGNDIFNLAGGSFSGKIFGERSVLDKQTETDKIEIDKNQNVEEEKKDRKIVTSQEVIDKKTDVKDEEKQVKVQSKKENRFNRDCFKWTGGTMKADSGFWGQSGKDEAIISAIEYDGTQIFDGGGGYNDKEMIDTLNFNLKKRKDPVKISNNTIKNWEIINIQGGSIVLSEELKTGNRFEQDLVKEKNPKIPLGLHIFESGSVKGTGGGKGQYRITGDVKNDGRITTFDEEVGDQITVVGNYTGKGIIELDVETKTGSSDTVIIDGDTTGKTQIKVKNISPKNATGEDITLIKVTGKSVEENYVASEDQMKIGGFNYNFSYEPGRYFYAANLNSTGATYASSAGILSSFNQLPSLHQRVSSKRYSVIKEEVEVGERSGWLRVYGNQANLSETTGTEVKKKMFGVQSGVDMTLIENDTTQWVFGVTGQFGKIDGEITQLVEDGNVEAYGYGFGGTATWNDVRGTYVDLQGQINWIESDFSSSEGGKLASEIGSVSTAMSIEGGRRMQIKEGNYFVVPQAQLTFGNIKSDLFSDIKNNKVDLGSSMDLVGRLGVTWEYDLKQSSYYVMGNLLHHFSDGKTIKISDAEINTIEESGTWADVGVGGYITANPQISFFWEALYRTPISSEDNSSGSAFGLSAGTKVQW